MLAHITPTSRTRDSPHRIRVSIPSLRLTGIPFFNGQCYVFPAEHGSTGLYTEVRDGGALGELSTRAVDMSDLEGLRPPSIVLDPKQVATSRKALLASLHL